MAQSSLIQVRIDETLKQDAEKLFLDLGIDTPTAVRMFLKQAVLRHGIPFPITTVDDFFNEYNQNYLLKAISDLDAGKGLVVKSMEELEAMENE